MQIDMEKIVIGCTRAGLTLKAELIKHLESKGFEVKDVGMKQDGKFVPYHQAAAAVAEEVSLGRCSKGIIICGTGAGSVIVAAKYKGVYPVHVTNEFTARKAKAVNDCNVLVFGEWLTPAPHAIQCVDTWLETEFGAGSDEDWKKFLRECVNDIAKMENERFR